LVLDESIVDLLSSEVRHKASKSTNEALVVHGRMKEKVKKREKGRSKSYGRHKSLGNSKEKCWNSGKVGNFKRGWKEEKKNDMKEKNYYDDESKKYSQEDGGDTFVATLTTHVG
jgi:hypothetical protein